jgi:drug/metabolite transporter (DMT)-like permease
MNAPGKPRVSPDLAVALLVLIWGSNFAVVKAALSEFSPLAFNALRFVIASALMLVFLRLAGMRVRIERRDVPVMIGLGILGNTAYQVLFILGIDWTLAGNAALMLAAVPIFVALMSVVLGHEKIHLMAWIGIFLSVAGIGFVVLGGDRDVSFGGETVRGDLTMLAAAVLWSAYTVGSSRFVRKYGTLPTTALTMWIGAAGLVLIAIPSLRAQAWSGISGWAWAGLLYSSVLGIAVAYLLWYYGVRHLGSSRTATYSNVIPLVALIVAWILLGEQPGLTQIVGAALILGGIGITRASGVEAGR